MVCLARQWLAGCDRPDLAEPVTFVVTRGVAQTALPRCEHKALTGVRDVPAAGEMRRRSESGWSDVGGELPYGVA